MKIIDKKSGFHSSESVTKWHGCLISSLSPINSRL